MNTAALKRFAQQARVILKEGVQARLMYWGFHEKGNVVEEPVEVGGGIFFRGEGIDDPSIYKKWKALKTAVEIHGVEHVSEEAAYTWFNRLMAIRILAKNGYIPPQLEYESELLQVPMIVGNARRGQLPDLTVEERNQLNELLKDDSTETQQFTLLITAFCRTNKLLSRVFGRVNDYTELLLPQDILSRNGFIHLLNNNGFISDEDYRQVELIGWLYQFYISEKKDEVFKSFKNKKKARAEDIPAATQIFTPNWIVKYMVQNTVGHIWLDLNPDSGIKSAMPYLVENPDAGKPEPLISEVSEIKLLDPACGSGHILVEGFDLLFAMYTEEGYSTRKAVRAIIRNNLYGLDIDLRAVQLANFALLLKATAKDLAILEEDITPCVYAMPEPYEFSDECVQTFLGDKAEYVDTLRETLTTMQQSQNLGSIMKIDITPETGDYLQTRLAYWEKRQDTISHAFLREEMGILFSYIRIILLLTTRYEAVAANPPYMGSGNMNTELKEYLAKHYPKSKSDLFAVFIEAMISLTREYGRLGCITMESWMFLSSYEKLRREILDNNYIVSLSHFGWYIIGIAFGTAAMILSKEPVENKLGEYSYLTIDDMDRDENIPFIFPKKDNGRFAHISQSNFEKMPGSPMAYWVNESILNIFASEKRIANFFNSGGRIKTHSNNEFIRFFWEISEKKIGRNFKWIFIENGGEQRKWYGNRSDVLNWTEEARERYAKHGGLSNPVYWEKEGVTWSIIGSGTKTFRIKTHETEFTSAAPTIIPSFLDDNLYFVLSFLNSKISNNLLKMANPTINTTVSDVLNLPIVEKNNLTIRCVKHNISIAKQDWDSRETSWDFQENELIKREQNNIEKSYQVYLKFWTEQFAQLHTNEVELNRIFIDIYGLQEELTPEVKLKDITILQEELDYNALGEYTEIGELPDPSQLPLKADEVMRQFISYAIGCVMGRYRLDQPGLHIAHPSPTYEELLPYVCNEKTFQIDDDAIVPLMDASSGFADNAVLRVKSFIRQVWGYEQEIQNINFLESSLGKDLETYLVKDFWGDHCRRYKKRPIYWLFSSPKGAFQVLIYMHRMNKYTVEKIRSNYLLKHIQGLATRRELLEKESANLDRRGQRELMKIVKDLEECRAYDLVLKNIADRQIEFDLDDGVKVNYEKFEDVAAKIK